MQSDYLDNRHQEVTAFETFTPRTLPGSPCSRNESPYVGRDVQTIGHSGRYDKHRHNRFGMVAHSPQNYHNPPSYHSPAHQQSQQNKQHLGSASGPGTYPDDIPERESGSGGKKVTFQTDLTTQNLKTWELCQKMNLQKDTGSHGNPGTQRMPNLNRPRSQDDDDNTTTSGSYTINPENDFDDILSVPFPVS